MREGQKVRLRSPDNSFLGYPHNETAVNVLGKDVCTVVLTSSGTISPYLTVRSTVSGKKFSTWAGRFEIVKTVKSSIKLNTRKKY